MGRAKNRKHPCPPFWQAMDSMRNGTAMLAWWRSGLRATPSVGPADPLAVAADPARAPHPGVAGALIDEVPAAALRLAGADSGCILRRQHRGEGPQDRPQRLTEVGAVELEHVAAALET